MPESPHLIASRRSSWQDSLTAIRSEPLTFCPSFPEITLKWNDWWACESERPLIVVQGAKTDKIRWDKAFDLLEQPEEWLRLRRRQVEETFHAGEAIPSVRVDVGPVAMAAFMGAPLHFADEGRLGDRPGQVDHLAAVTDGRVEMLRRHAQTDALPAVAVKDGGDSSRLSQPAILVLAAGLPFFYLQLVRHRYPRLTKAILPAGAAATPATPPLPELFYW